MEKERRTRSLSSLSRGERACVCCVTLSASAKRRLCEIGFNPGSYVTCLGRGPLGDPAAYLARDRIIAIRRRDAAKIKCITEEVL